MFRGGEEKVEDHVHGLASTLRWRVEARVTFMVRRWCVQMKMDPVVFALRQVRVAYLDELEVRWND